MTAPQRPQQLRRARAEALVRFEDDGRAAFDSSPALQTARVAGVMAARRATELLPYADPVELVDVEVTFEWEEEALCITGYVSGYGRAPLGIRALVAANVCAMTIVDMRTRGAGETIVERAQIIDEKGGLEALEYDFDPPVTVSIVVVSDAVESGRKEDTAGAAVETAVAGLGRHGVELSGYRVVGDDSSRIAQIVEKLVDEGRDLIVTVGGTGLAHTDVTVETVEPMLERPVPGLMEAVRAHGQEQTPVAFMSRGVAGLVGDTLLVTVPGSTTGAKESCQVLFPAVLHVFKTLRKSNEALEVSP